ncbi:hypothetical protein HPB48_026204 [Haemaphysalis longicornis]|uniref:Endonuclease/exonuclease/phosphatase domain-containing protein n=1 Tax=Haemaphysalis longicornis TaxID=44386 RepID=A0A9J6H926_HAELO|nr:hypothetical protein HPB48_026204 [Haemaphysalis longicornis]
MAANATGVTLWQCNCSCLSKKKKAVVNSTEHAARKPDVLLLQETSTAAPSLPGNRLHASQPNGSGFCTLVRRELTFLEHRLNTSRWNMHSPNLYQLRKGKREFFQLSAYGNPPQRNKKFKAPLHNASTTAGR